MSPNSPIHSQYADGTPVYRGQQPPKLPGGSRPFPDPKAIEKRNLQQIQRLLADRVEKT